MKLASLVADLAAEDLERATALVITGGPATVELRRDKEIRATWVDGFASLTEDLGGGWELVAVGDPVQFGVTIQGLGIRWGDPVDPAVATGLVEEPPPPPPKPARRRK